VLCVNFYCSFRFVCVRCLCAEFNVHVFGVMCVCVCVICVVCLRLWCVCVLYVCGVRCVI